MPSTIIKYGYDLAEYQVQPGWTLEQDGFGLMTLQVKYKTDRTNLSDFTIDFARGASDPGITELDYMKMWKASFSGGTADVATITADYVGIDPNINSGLSTNWQIAMVGSTASEAIEHHPNFIKVNCTSITGGSKLAGPPPANGWEPNLTLNPNRALWTPNVANKGVTNGQQFVGFLPAQKETDPVNIKAGIKSYFKPSMTLRCVCYFASEEQALTMASYNGWVTDGTTEIGIPEAYRKLAALVGYPGNFQYTSEYEGKIARGFLITNANVEIFGAIHKVTLDLMLSGISGWDKDVYPYITA